ncbi:MAG TPA: hypothetical protein VE646_11195 [Actinomycetota bacterium]|nr:hypothetical protein [Actinomycetota bacterium]
MGAVTLGAGSGSTAGSMGGVPPVCLQAIRAARAELGLRSELPQAYVQLFQRAVDAVRRGDTAALEEIAGELQDLNRRAQQGAQATLGDAFSRPARACESLSPGPPTPSAATASG